MYVKAGEIASTSVKVNKMTVNDVSMLLATGYENRGNMDA